jgi:phosphate-selective porin
MHQAGTGVPAWCSAHKAPRSVVSATAKTAPQPPKPGRVFQKAQTAISLGLALTLASGPVLATNTAMLQLLSALHKKGTKDKTGDFVWRTIGRVQYDNAFFDNNGNFKASDNNQFRRVRMGVMGTVATHWKFKVEYDLREVGTGIAGLKDAYIQYIGRLPGIDPIKHPVDIKIGQSYEPFSFELLNGANNALFTERALPANALIGGQQQRRGAGGNRT